MNCSYSLFDWCSAAVSSRIRPAFSLTKFSASASLRSALARLPYARATATPAAATAAVLGIDEFRYGLSTLLGWLIYGYLAVSCYANCCYSAALCSVRRGYVTLVLCVRLGGLGGC